MIENLDGTMEIVNYYDDARVKIYHNTEDEAYPIHWHAAAELTIVLEDNYKYIVQGTEVPLKRGDLLWVAPGALHAIEQPKNNGSRLIILFDPMILNNFSELSPIFSFLSPFYHVQASNSDTKTLHSTLQSLASEILTTELQGQKFKNVLIYSKIIEMCAAIGNAILEETISKQDRVESSNSSVPQAHLESIYNACDYIKNHSSEKITLDELASKAGFSKFYFSRLFKSFTSMSFIDYLNKCRIEEFERLITNPNNSITQAAFAVGFNSISSFNRVFKKNKGYSPSEYIAMAKNHNSGEASLLHSLIK